ncbi:MAG: aspartate aminotransferase family protein [Actinomycetia bacterium]|nr:aspartate aminotransferase family protein [Actinomycetes bacterium]MCP4962309.1 aspartate aminotransferase family protein [Actinomycetes bacterium]
MSDITTGHYPYAEEFGVVRGFPDEGREREEILAELGDIADRENRFWREGRVSGTMYCGDMDHYEFVGEAFTKFLHVNTIQRDICPSATRFEGEIIAMALDMLHADSIDSGREPAGTVTSGGTDSIVSSVLAHREEAQAVRGVFGGQVILPSSGHPAFRKGCHLFGLEEVVAPTDETTGQVDVDFVADHINDRTVMIVGSATNYGHGIIDPLEALSDLALEHDIGLHVDGCLGGFILPWGEALDFPVVMPDFRLPGVTAISADTHKFGYGPKGSSTLSFRDKQLRNRLYFLDQGWPGGKYFSPGMAGSRSGGMLAATWASMVSLGRSGYLEKAKAIFETAYAMQEVVSSHDELRIIGDPSFVFAFVSEALNVYHINDAMAELGWRFNGLQFPDALHMCVTLPQTAPGVVDTFAEHFADAVAYAKDKGDEHAASQAIYGGLPPEFDGFVVDTVSSILDAQLSVPPA